MTLLGLVTALVYTPTLSLIGDGVTMDDQGVAYGLNTWMFSISYLLAPWLGGILADAFSLRLPFYVCSIILIIGSFVVLKIAKNINQ